MTAADDHWFDRVAVERAVAGHRLTRSLTFPEIVEVARILISRGSSVTAVAEAHRCSPSRLRAALDG